MKLSKLAYRAYVGARALLRATGLAKPLRNILGPMAGRLVASASGHKDRPMKIGGHQMIISSQDRYPPVDMAMDRYERETTRQFRRLISPGMVVIDVGAHVGYYTLLAAKQVGPTGKVYAFEPEPVNHGLLLRNVELNGYDNVVVVKSAVSDDAGSTTLYLTGLDNGRHSVYQHNLPENGSVEVPTTKIDDFLELQGWPSVDLIKIDVEGAELDVLAGMERLLRESKGIRLILEFNPCLLQSAGVTPLEFLERPGATGFQACFIDEAKGLIPLTAMELPSMVAELAKSEGSVNLLWSKLPEDLLV